MSRKLKLSSLQGRLLLMLEEAGNEDFGTIVATLAPSSLSEFEREVKDLLQTGLVKFYRDLGVNFRYTRLTSEEIDDLPSFEEMTKFEDGRVISFTMDERVFAGIMLTDEGLDSVWA